MPSGFNFTASPFDCLDRREQELVRNSVDIGYFEAGETILDVGVVPTHLYVVIKGYVRQVNDSEEVAVYGPEDCFDGRGLVAGRVSDRFVAIEEVIAYQLSKSAVNELISSNATFGALLFEDLSNKLNAISARRSQHELNSLSMARVRQAFLRPATFVDAMTTVRDIAEIFNRDRINSVLVRDQQSDPPRLGIFTLGSLSRAILDGTPPNELRVGKLAHWGLVRADPDEYLYDALAKMVRHRVTRVVVMERDEVLGLLEQVDLLSFVSNSSSLIVQRILQAQTLEQLKEAATEITKLVALLHGNGTRVGMIAQLVQELNTTLFERAWSLIASPEILENSCLFVMGSEGRGEQLLKTDQDNGLLLRDGFDDGESVARACARFSKVLEDFGYPECPGGIMVSNPEWRMHASRFSQRAKSWLLEPTPESLMSLAIFMDAHAVIGDSELLASIKRDVFALVNDNQFLLARFAAAIESFSTEPGWWNRLLSLGDKGGEHLNLKKVGIFAIVHGIRSMALEHRLTETSTVERIERLVELNKISRETASELIEGLHFMMALKLKAGLTELDTDKPVSGLVDTSSLTSLERDLLKDALQAVKRFKSSLKQHYKLEAL